MFFRRFGLFLVLSTLFLSPRLYGEESRSLSVRECKELYAHELRVFASQGLLAPAIELNRSVMGGSEAEQRQIRQCRKTIGYTNYRCQLAVSTVLALEECNRLHGGPSEKQESAASQNGSSDSEKRGSKESREQPPAPTVDRGECKRAYQHLLAIFQKSPYLEGSSDREQLLRYWQSSEAREVFQNRCMTVYRPSDIECILSGSDREMLQACLLQVPSR